MIIVEAAWLTLEWDPYFYGHPHKHKFFIVYKGDSFAKAKTECDNNWKENETFNTIPITKKHNMIMQ